MDEAMDRKNGKGTGDICNIKPEAEKNADLPEDYWQSVLDLPSCKTMGICDDCGRCER